MRTMITATNTMSQLQKQMDTIGNNLANLNTTGYKRREVNFSELLYQQFNNQPFPEQEVGRLTPNGIRQGVGAKLGHTNISMTQGSIKTTDRPLDIAFTKEGQFLQVMVEENGVQTPHFTRDGALYLSPLADGSNQVGLVNSSGNPVLDEDGDPITFFDNFKEVNISPNGVISVIPSQAGLPNQVYNLSVVEVHRPQLLESVGGNLFALPNLNELGVAADEVFTSLQGNLRGQVGMQQGALEQSNVDMSTEMSDLLMAQRSYQFNAKSISISDQMMGLVNGIR
ncbi:flagellar hook-basal body protein [Ferdinandcohnia quinoae]|uniref:Flagellar hook-basal body protein n=1 Tax=Fredinandcohnia quinoae TaxID=2918902 RepID=A0AAW5E8T4_9BACI|nr:flagellar hook-basal body protein [Fredinandcohnia sp. SECRCQ15]MCH1625179.1 flagellar hook-basal body protein [Fredinandcohnia sp. SECRCQ15]